jgi:GST-like protein
LQAIIHLSLGYIISILALYRQNTDKLTRCGTHVKEVALLKLYFHDTPNPRKVALFLEETTTPYEVVGVDIWAAAQHQPAYRAINPNGKVPAIVDGDVTMFDSNAILLFLAERSGQFLGAPDERPQLLSWLMFTASGLGPFSGQAYHFLHVHKDSAYAANRYAREVERHFTVLDTRLSATPWLAGRAYTIADMAAWGWVDFAVRNRLVFGDGDAARWPHLQRWLDAINARPAADRARRAGERLTVKTTFDEETARALFPQNFAERL